MLAGLVVFAAFVVWSERMPAGFDSIRGLNPLAAAEWRTRFHAGQGSTSAATYRAAGQVLQVASWVIYGVLLALVYRGGRLSARWTWRLAVPLLLVVAVAMPAALSSDVFAYVGYARLAVVHGLNPHLYTQTDLVRLGDPTKPYLHWPIASPYGPLWTMVCVGVVALGRLFTADGIWGVVLALKLIAAVGVLGVAAALRTLVRRGDDAGRADTAFVLAIANPLMLCEGPGNGHNDVVMMALVLYGFVVWLTPASGRARPAAAAALFGLSAAVKLIPLLLLPWVALTALRANSGGAVARRWARACGIVCLGLAPVVLTYAPFWSGGRALGGLVERFRSADRSDDDATGGKAQPATSAKAGTAGATAPDKIPDADKVTNVEKTARVGRVDPHPLGHVLRRTWLTALIYFACTIALWRGGATLLPLTAWAYVSGAVMFFVAGLWFPWYLIWTWPAALARATRQHQFLTLFLFLFSVLLMMVYGMPPP